MKTWRSSIFSLVILLVLCVGYLFFSRKGTDDATPSIQYTPVASESEGLLKRSNGTELPTQVSTKRTRPIKDPADRITQGELYKDLIQIFGDAEAERATLLSRTRHQNETWYLFGVTPPSANEVGILRRKLAIIQRSAPPMKGQSFDDLVGFSIDCYDPFATDGLRSVLIRVPDDPQGRIYGGVFSSKGFDEDKERFDPRHPDDHVFENYRGFIREDGKTPERFASLVKKDPNLAEQAASFDGDKDPN